MLRSLYLLSIFTLSFNVFAQTDVEPQTSAKDKPLVLSRDIEKASTEIFGTDPRNKFSLYQPNYFVFGKENLKMQFSAKYRVARTYNVYLAYTQLMFWDIYKRSQPFNDINYNPEAFYRLVDDEELKYIKSIDFGFSHTSNGEDSEKSRSINRIFLKTNFVTKLGRNNILGEFKLHHIYSKDSATENIIDYLGYWDLKLILTHVLVHNAARLDLEFRLFAGKSVVNLGKGGRELGLIYYFGSNNFNPAIYMQYYSGYAESLLHFNQKVSQVRLGLLLFY